MVPSYQIISLVRPARYGNNRLYKNLLVGQCRSSIPYSSLSLVNANTIGRDRE